MSRVCEQHQLCVCVRACAYVRACVRTCVRTCAYVRTLDGGDGRWYAQCHAQIRTAWWLLLVDRRAHSWCGPPPFIVFCADDMLSISMGRCAHSTPTRNKPQRNTQHATRNTNSVSRDGCCDLRGSIICCTPRARSLVSPVGGCLRKRQLAPRPNHARDGPRRCHVGAYSTTSILLQIFLCACFCFVI